MTTASPSPDSSNPTSPSRKTAIPSLSAASNERTATVPARERPTSCGHLHQRSSAPCTAPCRSSSSMSPAPLQKASPAPARTSRTTSAPCPAAGTRVATFLLSPTKGLMLVQGFTTDGELRRLCPRQAHQRPVGGTPRATHHDAALVAAIDQLANDVAGIRGRKNPSGSRRRPC